MCFFFIEAPTDSTDKVDENTALNMGAVCCWTKAADKDRSKDLFVHVKQHVATTWLH